jgi:hypothetical protein
VLARDLLPRIHPMPKWLFSLYYHHGEASHWTWTRVADDGAIIRKSAHRFPSFLQCVRDAEKHGYEPRNDMFPCDRPNDSVD